ncbi:MAG: hypothetical protein KDA78_03460, partial [Planctomycetaceae bacterium]|nr:hypothetical protein [Planctomycetaceae bacterium]
QVASDAQSQAAITIHTLGALVDGGDAGQFDLMADQGTVILMTAQGIGDANSLETLVRELQITNTGSGRVQINEGSALLLNQILQQANDDVTITSAGTMQLLATGAGIELSGGDLQMQTLGALSQLELLQSVSTAGGMLQLLSGADLLLGENVQLVSSGGNLIAAAGQATPDASFTMALTSSIELGSGTGNIQASGAVSVAQISTTTQLLVTSLNSEIQNPFADQTVQFTANELGLSAAAGIGNGTMLSTAVNLLAAETTLAGNIAVLNQSGQLLTVGTVAGLTGVQHLGSVAGDIIIINQSPLMIGENVINFSGGDIELTALGNTPQSDLTVAAPVLAQIPGEIRLNAGHDLLIHDTGVEFDIAARSITGRAENTVEIDRNVIIRSATGSVIDKLPLLEGIVTPQVKATGEASVSGDFGRLFEQTFSIQVDWADGQIDTNPEAAPTPDSFTYEHRYFGNPDPNNPAAPIPILVSIFDDPNITFFEAGQEVLLPPILSFAEVPGEGLAGGIAFDLSIEVPELGSSSSSGIDLSSSTATVSIEEQDVVDQVADSDEQTFLAGRRITLRVLNSKGIVIEEILLEGAQAEELLSDFIGFVDKHQLPDGRYQILQQEPGEASFRIVFDLLLRNGRPADNSEGLQDRPPTENQ